MCYQGVGIRSEVHIFTPSAFTVSYNKCHLPSTNGMAVSAGHTPAEIIGDVEQNKDRGEQADSHISKKCLCSWDLGALGALGSLIKKLCAPRAELGVFGSNWSMGSAESET